MYGEKTEGETERRGDERKGEREGWMERCEVEASGTFASFSISYLRCVDILCSPISLLPFSSHVFSNPPPSYSSCLVLIILILPLYLSLLFIYSFTLFLSTPPNFS